MSKQYAIDLPDPFDLETAWINYDYFDSFEDALKVAKHFLGADDKGNINIISEIDNNDDD